MIFFPITFGNCFLREIFSSQHYTLRNEGQQASGIPGLSFSSLSSAGALDKQAFSSLQQWVRIKAFLAEAHWDFPHPLTAKFHFLLCNLYWFCHKEVGLLFLRLQQNASQPTAENCRAQCVLYEFPPLWAERWHSWGLLHQRTLLPAKCFALCLKETKPYQMW